MSIDRHLRPEELLESTSMIKMQVTHNDHGDVADLVASTFDLLIEFLAGVIVDLGEDVVDGWAPDFGIVLPATGLPEDQAGCRMLDQQSIELTLAAFVLRLGIGLGRRVCLCGFSRQSSSLGHNKASRTPCIKNAVSTSRYPKFRICFCSAELPSACRDLARTDPVFGAFGAFDQSVQRLCHRYESLPGVFCGTKVVVQTYACGLVGRCSEESSPFVRSQLCAMTSPDEAMSASGFPMSIICMVDFWPSLYRIG